MDMVLLIIIYLILSAASLAVFICLMKEISPEEAKLPKWGSLMAVLCGIGFCFPLAGSLIPDGPACWFFNRWGNIYLGFAVYFFGPLLGLGAVSLIMQKMVLRGRRLTNPQTGKRIMRMFFCGVLILSFGLNVYGFFKARRVEVTRYEMEDASFPAGQTLRIVFISDLHISVNSSLSHMREMAERINEQDADVVLIGGDIITSSFKAMGPRDKYREILKGIQAKYGVYGVYGNHDVEEPLLGGFSYMLPQKARRSPEFTEFLKDCGFRMLEDETVVLPELGGLVIAGRKDGDKQGDGTAGRAPAAALLKDVDAAAPLILLEHEPVELDTLSEYGIDLCLCGHTHNGQIFPGNYVVRLFAEQSYGQKDWDGCRVIVSSGVGFYGSPIRVGTISEIVVIDISGGE